MRKIQIILILLAIKTNSFAANIDDYSMLDSAASKNRNLLQEIYQQKNICDSSNTNSTKKVEGMLKLNYEGNSVIFLPLEIKTDHDFRQKKTMKVLVYSPFHESLKLEYRELFVDSTPSDKKRVRWGNPQTQAIVPVINFEQLRSEDVADLFPKSKKNINCEIQKLIATTPALKIIAESFDNPKIQPIEQPKAKNRSNTNQ